jgi:hypothetical protein
MIVFIMYYIWHVLSKHKAKQEVKYEMGGDHIAENGGH